MSIANSTQVSSSGSGSIGGDTVGEAGEGDIVGEAGEGEVIGTAGEGEVVGAAGEGDFSGAIPGAIPRTV